MAIASYVPSSPMSRLSYPVYFFQNYLVKYNFFSSQINTQIFHSLSIAWQAIHDDNVFFFCFSEQPATPVDKFPYHLPTHTKDTSVLLTFYFTLASASLNSFCYSLCLATHVLKGTNQIPSLLSIFPWTYHIMLIIPDPQFLGFCLQVMGTFNHAYYLYRSGYRDLQITENKELHRTSNFASNGNHEKTCLLVLRAIKEVLIKLS